MNRPSLFKRIRSYTVAPFLPLLALWLICTVLLLLSVLSTRVADALDGTVGQGVRFFLAKLTTLLPFSLAELLIYLVPTLLTFALVYLFVRARDVCARLRVFSSVVCVALCVSVLHTLTLGIAYRTTRLDEKLSITREAVSADELYRTTMYLKEQTEALLDDITFGVSGSSVMPYSVDELSQKLCDAYDAAKERYGVVQSYRTRVKTAGISKGLSYAHILGVYTFFTGEANLNIDYPSYNFPFTAAHELSHQRGIAREDEANFMAYLVCLESEDAYIRYSGYANLLVYLLNAYHRAVGTDVYRELYMTLDERIRGEYRAESLHAEQYDTAFGDLSSATNDVYLKANGTEGTVSYGFVVDLAIAFYKDKIQ